MNMNLSASEILNIVIMALYLIMIALYFIVVPRLPKNVQDQVRAVANDVVPFIEQRAGTLDGPQKFAAASQKVVEVMALLGFKSVPAALVEVAIEAAVYDLKRATQVVQDVQAAQPAVSAQPTLPVVPPPAQAQ